MLVPFRDPVNHQVLANLLKFKVGVLAGVKIGDQNTPNRETAVQHLNDGLIDILIMTPRVGAYGLNITGASYMLFLGSLYSSSMEKQCIGKSLTKWC